jgi:DNA-binding transcriptional regulator YhcF (GntR family)
MLTITIDRTLGDAVYVQVARQVRDLVASGVLVPGTPIPSVRQLARDLGVNLNTVARAYRLLETEGFLVIRDRAGVSVASPRAAIEASTLSDLTGELRATLARLRQAGLSSEELRALLARELESSAGGPGGAQS